MLKFVKIFLFLVLLSNASSAQNISYSYINYTIKDGLAGNIVYCVTQDKEGFIWFGTETGLSRFDGTHFKSYTIKDGLPDNEIIETFCDSKGRVWFAPFKKSVCYYYKGKIYNQENDRFLASMRIKSNIVGFCEDNEGNFYFNEKSRLSVITKKNTIKYYDTLNNTPLYISFIQKDYKTGINILSDKWLVNLKNSQTNKIILKALGASQNSYALSSKYLIVDGDYRHTPLQGKFIFNLQTKEYKTLNSDHNYNSHSIINDSLLAVNRVDGCIVYKLNNLQAKPDTLLKGISISKVMLDREGQLWFLSFGNGIYQLKSNSILNLKAGSEANNSNIVYVKKDEKKLVAQTNSNEVIETANNFKTISSIKFLILGRRNEKLVGIVNIKNRSKIYITSGRLKIKNKFYLCAGSIKDYQVVNDSIIYIATSAYSFSQNIKHLSSDSGKSLIIQNEKIILSGRSTCIYHDFDSTFVGTLNGLFVVKNDKTNYCLSTLNKIFERRISAIKKAKDSTLWVGTYDAGVAAYRNGKVVQIFNDSNGLTSNICRNLFVNGNYLWIGTDKGLNKIDISKPPYKIVINYTTTDGLASNMINAVYTDSNMVYVGTPEGLTFFDETKIVNKSTCDMRILGITVSGKEQQWDSSKIILAHNDNNVRFDFVALSFKSAGDITYNYRLLGLDEEWKTTRENYLSYPSLPSGNYTLEIQATNKFGVKSSIVKIDVEIKKLLIEKNWFRLLLLLTGIGLIYAYFTRRIKKINRKAREQAAITEKVNEMEQMALRAQMNPHFIFNCLNSIQDYVINSDVQGANKFITDFSRLIRSTLDNSSKKIISIEDEIKYLTNYLTIEQYRFENKFTFNIHKDEDINLYDNYIPPMLLQPYVENAIRHGINNKKTGIGLIEINISKKDTNLICEVIDNGIGIKAAMELKGNTAIEYQSKGMELTAKRIQLLNKNVGEDIEIKIEDAMFPKMGTKVIISIPLI